jgi:4-alpha-glucanotransferase
MSREVTVTFHLCAERLTGAAPFIFGGCAELGDGDPSKAIPLLAIDSPYSYHRQIRFPALPEKLWYSYCFRPRFGSLILESVPLRHLPDLVGDADVYDRTECITPIDSLVVRFRVRCRTEFGQQLYWCAGSDLSRARQMFYEGRDDYWTCSLRLPLLGERSTLEYHYLLAWDGSDVQWERETAHRIVLAPVTSPAYVEVEDMWRWSDPVLEAFTRSAFVDVINKRGEAEELEIVPNTTQPGFVHVTITARCPALRTSEQLVLVGGSDVLGNWDVGRGVAMSSDGFPDWWSGTIRVPSNAHPFDYKFVVTSRGRHLWETGPNRSCPAPGSPSGPFPATVLITNWYASPNPDLFRGLGVYCPLFSLRTGSSCGIGQYGDIKELADLCNRIGASLIQLLPIRDTNDTGGYQDSYPYRQVSCFALNPIYIDLLAVCPGLPSGLSEAIESSRAVFEAKPEVDYKEVLAFKLRILQEIFRLVDLDADDRFTAFVEAEAAWLRPYALFCLLRDRYGTSDFRRWPDYSTVTDSEVAALCDKFREQLQFTYWVQYVCDVQFQDARRYANSRVIVLKGDLPIGVSQHSCECWMWPRNFRLDMQTGAPPDQFSGSGQNWGFPTYDWDFMERDGFRWWQLRLQRMAKLFQAIRVDHVLGFFRIWEIARAASICGLLGYFSPCLPLSANELERAGLRDLDRYVRPYVRWHLLVEKFGSYAVDVSRRYFEPRNVDRRDDWYDFKPAVNTERKIIAALREDFPDDAATRERYQEGIFELLANVLLIPDESRPRHFHVRTEVGTEKIEMTSAGLRQVPSSSLSELAEPEQSAFRRLYVDFTYRRQTAFWVGKAERKLGVLKESTNMLICAEDLGQITEGIIAALDNSGMLTLRVQRMAKFPSQQFDRPRDFPYLAVCCPSTHDMSSLRGWWEEDPGLTASFWYNELGMHGTVPSSCEPFIVERIIRQHLESNAMWAIFLLQDLTALAGDLRRQPPDAERINQPADPDQIWAYRYPYTVKELQDNYGFVNQLRGLVGATHRI